MGASIFYRTASRRLGARPRRPRTFPRVRSSRNVERRYVASSSLFDFSSNSVGGIAARRRQARLCFGYAEFRKSSNLRPFFAYAWSVPYAAPFPAAFRPAMVQIEVCDSYHDARAKLHALASYVLARPIRQFG